MQPRKLVPFNTDSLNITINDHTALEAFFISRKAKGGAIGHDVETTVHEDFFNRKMRTSQFGDQKEQHVQDLLALCDGDSDLLEKAQGHFGKNLHLAPKLQAYVKSVQKVLESGDFTKVGVNLGFEYMTWYWNFGIRMWKLWDCSQVERVIYAGAHSLKQYSFFALDAMAERYFGSLINKDLQTSFTIDGELSLEQFKYACVDTRVPMGLKGAQQIILDGRTAKNNTNPANAAILAYLDPLVTGDDLNKAEWVENNCIGFFTDMYVHGDRIDTERWLARTEKKKALLKKNIEELDAIFIPIPLVGKKTDIVTDEEIAEARAKWKAHAEETTAEKHLKKVTQAELDLGKQIRNLVKLEMPGIIELAAQKDQIKFYRLSQAAELAEARVAVKEALKKEASALGKKRTRLKKLAAQCEGEALIHYKSNAQLKAVLVKEFPSLKNIKKLDDDVLQAHKKKHPVMALILQYHKLSKEIGTYGDQWAKCWITHPCKEEGWLNPGDGRLHPVFSPFDAETGRSSSEKPNGQNLPQDPEIRQCFIADPPDESIRICRDCKTECEEKFNNGNGGYMCVTCQLLKAIEDTDPEEFILLTCDMSGAELRIIAELSGDPIWIGCFERGEDVHSVGTEILQGQKWIDATEEGCLYYKDGKKLKCDCKGHKKLRNGTKAINFLLAYGGGPQKLAQELGVTVDEAVALMELHESMFPRVWAYLSKSGMNAKMTKKAFDLFGGRRLFPKPTVERAIQWCRDRKEEKLRLPEETCQKNIAAYIVRHGKKPDKDTLFDITHRKPTQKEINSGLGALAGSIERQGKNHAIQGSNARIAKVAFGSGFDNNGSPFLWHLLPQWKAKSIKFVHDEIVISCPKRFALQVANAVQDCIKRAAGLVMKSVIMESEYNIDTHWSK